jgi:hypothetical protein
MQTLDNYLAIKIAKLKEIPTFAFYKKSMAKDDLIRFDWAVKHLLRQKSNYVVLEGLLSTLLNEDIRIEGERAKALSIAQKALQRGKSIADIMDLTGLMETDIEEIQTA